jgi:hypothetical protein
LDRCPVFFSSFLCLGFHEVWIQLLSTTHPCQHDAASWVCNAICSLMICVFLGSDCDKCFFEAAILAGGSWKTRPGRVTRESCARYWWKQGLAQAIRGYSPSCKIDFFWQFDMEFVYIPSIHPLQLRPYREGKDKNKKGATLLPIWCDLHHRVPYQWTLQSLVVNCMCVLLHNKVGILLMYFMSPDEGN